MLAGIVGKPSVGKSTFFSAITLLPVKISSRPFTTVKPNRGIGYVRTVCVCKELGVKDQPVSSLCVNGVRLIPVELIDCIGLVPGAHEGRGLGNSFLDEIRRADAVIHIIDASGSSDAEGNCVKPGTRDPIEDVKFLENEVAMWFSDIIIRKMGKLAKLVEVDKKSIVDVLHDEWSGLNISKRAIGEGLSTTDLDRNRPSSWSKEEVIDLSMKVWRVAKPTLIVANKVDVPGAEDNLERLKKLPYPVIPCCAEAELALRRAAEKGVIAYTPGDDHFTIAKDDCLTSDQKRALNLLEERALKRWGSTGVQQTLNHAYFNLLGVIAVYPVRDIDRYSDKEGRVLPDAYLVPKGTTARQLAYLIHQDLGKSFLYALDARTKKRLGEGHILADGDVVKIVSTSVRG